ncbi:MFS transporter [Mongoliitalea lutea]|uniref:Membrane protein n=1 Tax=Mongoliitalea lutea TaxID=849756 RepID=A0A8J3CVU4_9BACT|nr:MFS transporter [Mongoliitalea lutea]GHB24909.1 membrane protein [Mongoliitalea lutea]
MNKILSKIVVAQFFATSLWFAGNAVVQDLAQEYGLADTYLAHITSSVQVGFIVGTLFFAIFTIADRFSPSKVFFISALMAASLNLSIVWLAATGWEILALRFGTGFFLAGIYPVGMKIAADYFDKGLGKSLGLLVGALVLGTSFPHLIKAFSDGLPWAWVLYGTSALAMLGGILILLGVPDGPHRKKSQGIDFRALSKVFQVPKFRAAAFGYFGHMWELYTFWAFVPVFLAAYMKVHTISLDIPFISFCVIGIGGLSCALGGFLSEKLSPAFIAGTALKISGICSALSPLFFLQPSTAILLIFLMVWGMAVTADSPMFSTLVATYAPINSRATALTIVNSIGFALTIPSIQLAQFFFNAIPAHLLLFALGLGPLLGLYFFKKSF